MATAPWEFLVQACVGAREVVLVAPYMKLETLNKLLSKITGDLHVVSRWLLKDIALGASDIHCRTVVANHEGHFYLHPLLHAKYYRFDDVVYVGSANLTSTGLGLGSISNLEILCPPSSAFDIVRFERQIFEESHEVSDWEFSQWQKLEPSALLPTPISTWSTELRLSDWWPHTREPAHLWQVYTSHLDGVASLDERTMASRDITALSIPHSLSYSQFHAWVTSCLLSSPFFIDAVMKSTQEDNQDTTYRLADTWGITARTAARRLGTAQAWKAYFLD